MTYTGVGLLLSSIFGAAGVIRLATNPWVNLGIAAIFTFFAFSLIGIFELQLPAKWVQSADRLSRKKNGSTLGTLLMGMTFTLTAFTCTVQFAGTLLIAAANGDWLWPVVGMIVFSSVFSLPFFLLALFPRWANSLQSKSGIWMVQMKALLGLIELMAVIKFVSNADLVWGLGWITRPIVLSLWGLLSFFCVLVILGVFHDPGFKQLRKSWLRWLWVGIFLLPTFYFLQGATGKSLDSWTESYLPPRLESGRSGIIFNENLSFQPVTLVHELPWHDNLEDAMAAAKQQQKPIFVDFTGYTCVNCRWMEKNVFAEKSVFQLLKDEFILVQLYTDGGENAEKNQNLQIDRFNTIALPFYALLSPDNVTLAKHTGISSPTKFFKFLQKSL